MYIYHRWLSKPYQLLGHWFLTYFVQDPFENPTTFPPEKKKMRKCQKTLHVISKFTNPHKFHSWTAPLQPWKFFKQRIQFLFSLLSYEENKNFENGKYLW